MSTSPFLNQCPAQLERNRLAVFDPVPLPKETRESMKAISSFLSAQRLAADLAKTMMTLWSAVGNEEDSLPSTDEVRGSLLKCSEMAWLVARVTAAEDSITYRLHQADLHEAQHGGWHHGA